MDKSSCPDDYIKYVKQILVHPPATIDEVRVSSFKNWPQKAWRDDFHCIGAHTHYTFHLRVAFEGEAM